MAKKEVALITGGGTGIGFAIAKKLHSMNKTVVLTGRRKEKLLQAKKILKTRCHILEHDILETSVEDTIDTMRLIDALMKSQNNFLKIQTS